MTTTTTTLPVTLGYSRASLITTTVKMAFTYVGQTTSGKHDVVLLPQLIPRDTMGGFCCLQHYATAMTTSVPDAFSGISQLCHESSSGAFSLSELSLPQILMLHAIVYYGVCFLLSGSHVAPMFTNENSTIGVYNTATLQSIPLAGICPSW